MSIGRVQAHVGLPLTGICTSVAEDTSGRVAILGIGLSA